MNILKSIAAVLAGLIFIVATHTITDKILESAGIFPSPEQGLHVTWMLVAALVYRVLFQVAGSFITAWLAPSRPFLHGMIIGVIGLILGSVGAAVAIPMNLSPAWYPIALALSALPSAWLGSTMYASFRR
jgi:hypothetical protein